MVRLSYKLAVLGTLVAPSLTAPTLTLNSQPKPTRFITRASPVSSDAAATAVALSSSFSSSPSSSHDNVLVGGPSHQSAEDADEIDQAEAPSPPSVSSTNPQEAAKYHLPLGKPMPALPTDPQAYDALIKDILAQPPNPQPIEARSPGKWHPDHKILPPLNPEVTESHLSEQDQAKLYRLARFACSIHAQPPNWKEYLKHRVSTLTIDKCVEDVLKRVDHTRTVVPAETLNKGDFDEGDSDEGYDAEGDDAEVEKRGDFLNHKNSVNWKQELRKDLTGWFRRISGYDVFKLLLSGKKKKEALRELGRRDSDATLTTLDGFEDVDFEQLLADLDDDADLQNVLGEVRDELSKRDSMRMGSSSSGPNDIDIEQRSPWNPLWRGDDSDMGLRQPERKKLKEEKKKEEEERQDSLKEYAAEESSAPASDPEEPDAETPQGLDEGVLSRDLHEGSDLINKTDPIPVKPWDYARPAFPKPEPTNLPQPPNGAGPGWQVNRGFHIKNERERMKAQRLVDEKIKNYLRSMHVRMNYLTAKNAVVKWYLHKTAHSVDDRRSLIKEVVELGEEMRLMYEKRLDQVLRRGLEEAEGRSTRLTDYEMTKPKNAPSVEDMLPDKMPGEE